MLTCAIVSISGKSRFTSAIKRSLGIITQSAIFAAVVSILDALVNIWKRVDNSWYWPLPRCTLTFVLPWSQINLWFYVRKKTHWFPKAPVSCHTTAKTFSRSNAGTLIVGQWIFKVTVPCYPLTSYIFHCRLHVQRILVGNNFNW